MLLFQFSVFVCILFILPTAHPTDAQNMNYAVVAVGGLLMLTTIAWLMWGRFNFNGPVRTVPSDGIQGDVDATVEGIVGKERGMKWMKDEQGIPKAE